jgi:hypothetical protein
VAKFKNKVITSGNMIEIIRYEKLIKTGDDRKQKKSETPDWIIEEMKGVKEKESEESIQKRNGKRARMNLMRLAEANARHQWKDHEGKHARLKFMTLTYKANVTDLEKANKDFEKFTKRLTYHVSGEKKAFLKYLAVVEFQERGAIHYHVLFFNLPYIDVKEIAKVWGFGDGEKGGVKINECKNVDNIGAYLIKYMGKTMDQADAKTRRDKDKKRYFSSRGLIKPEVKYYRNEEELAQLEAELARHEVYAFTSENDYLGTVNYKQYNTKRLKK